MNPFLEAPEFIQYDNRIHRAFSPVSPEQMWYKHEALLPREVVAGRTVLDLGCGIGATGHWCLQNGATYYTGVEPQQTYAHTATELLNARYPDRAHILANSLEEYVVNNNEQYDIVSVLAVLHSSVDLYSRLQEVAARARTIVAIEELMPRRIAIDPTFTGIEFSGAEGTNLADENASLAGRGARISPQGLAFVMRGFGFSASDVLPVRPISDTIDNFNTPPTPSNARYLMRFTREGDAARSASEDMRAGARDRIKNW